MRKYTYWISRCVLSLCSLGLCGSFSLAAERPNVLWITCEDLSPHLGCYGDAQAITPNLDRLAAQGVRYTNAFAPIGVCAPSRSTLILGMWAPSVGTQHMRCTGTLPTGVMLIVKTSYEVDWNALMAASILMSVPVLAAIIGCQRYLLSGFGVANVKG